MFWFFSKLLFKVELVRFVLFCDLALEKKRGHDLRTISFVKLCNIQFCIVILGPLEGFQLAKTKKVYSFLMCA